MKKLRYIVVWISLSVCFLISHFAFSHSWSRQIDSLQLLLKNDKEDTGKVIHASQLCWEYWSSGSYDTAMQYGNTALQLALKLNYPSGIASAYNNTGLVYYSRANYPRAQDHFFNALKLHERLLAQVLVSGNQTTINGYKNEMARNIGNIGLVYDIQEEYSKAIGYYLKALKLFEEIGNKNKICTALGNIGGVYKSMGDYAHALDVYGRALKIAVELGNKNAIGRISGNIGNVCFEQEDFNRAKDHFLSAVDIAREIGDNNRIPIWLGNIGMVYKAQSKFIEAEDYLLSAAKLYKEIDDPFGQMEISKGLSELYVKTGKYDKALAYYKSSMILKDSLFNDEKNQELTRKEMNYEFEKKEAAAKAEQEKQLAIAIAEKQKQQYILILVSCFLSLVLVFAGFIFRSLRIAHKQKQLIEKQKHLVEEKQKEILDSIHYAKRIQTALLPTDRYIDKTLTRLIKK